MSIFDKFKKTVQTVIKETAVECFSSEETFTFSALPENLEEMKALPEAASTMPFCWKKHAGGM